MNEIQKFKGRLEEKKLEAKNLKLRIEGDVTALRELLDPFIPAQKLKADVIAAQAVELAGKQSQLKEVLADIDAIKDALGRE